MVDKEYCMSSFLAFRYIVNDDKQFAEGLMHRCPRRISDAYKQLVADAADLDVALSNVFRTIAHERLGLLLSGGMDSAILASYMPKGADAYTFRFLGGGYQADELHRAELFAKNCGLNLHYVDINWNVVTQCLDKVMLHKSAPVHSIEPQIYYATQMAKRDGVTLMVVGDGSDYVFGGMDGLYSQDWSFDDFVKRYIYVDPKDVLNDPVDMTSEFEPYRIGPKSIDFIRLMDELTIDESYSSYENAFDAAEMPHIDPYAKLKMAHPLNIARLRSGDSKYIVRDLFCRRYPAIPLPEKLPMPRPVDAYFADWKGPTRPEFRQDIDISRFTGNQRWLIWCLERFLDVIQS